MSQGWRHFPFARVDSIHDADTFTLDVDSGFGASHKVVVRLFGLSAPEVTGVERPMGLRALDASKRFLGYSCKLWTWKMSFERYVSRIVIGESDVVIEQLKSGIGRAWDGKTERPRFVEFPIVDVLSEIAMYEGLLARDFKP